VVRPAAEFALHLPLTVLSHRVYYGVKPFLPWQARMAVRRWIAVRQRRRTADEWPILPGSETPPRGWPGWPDGKQFALVITHDVEGPAGLERVKPLAELEISLGFRSCFKFIPEGGYHVPDSLRDWLTANGFEVAVHDLHHNGSLYHGREKFLRQARRINQYLKDWQAVGFRSAFTFHRLDWLHDLDIQYDSSTFDTDPFEPQPDGVGTIFPFWVSREQGAGSREQGARGQRTDDGGRTSDDRGQRTEDGHTVALAHRRTDAPAHRPAGYVELPYTLPQDSTLFLLFREQDIGVWQRKLDWIALHRGMALVNVHPDYVNFTDRPQPRQFPVRFYQELLEHVRRQHADRCWHALPRHVAALVAPPAAGTPPQAAAADRQPEAAPPPADGHEPGTLPPRRTVPRLKPRIWIDLDNTPHVPFFQPIIQELEARGFSVLVTARDAFQVYELAEKKGLRCVRIGHHYGKNRLAKGWGLAYRALELAPLIFRQRPILAVSHGARSQLILGHFLRIPTLLIEDYEHARFPWPTTPDWVLAPGVIPPDALPQRPDRILSYSGLKEEVYAWRLQPDETVLPALGIRNGEIVVTVRPPATEAHYHNPESEALFVRFMDRVCGRTDTRVVLLPRNKRQEQSLRARWPAWFAHQRTVIPPQALDGLNLIWFSDLVVSGGGTMNREAAALGVPVYSIFRGRIGAVDQQLCREGRLLLLQSPEDVDQRIHLQKRHRPDTMLTTSRQTLGQIVDTIVEVAQGCRMLTK